MSAPSCIQLIRHGEKPHGTVLGVDADGRQDPASLSPRGWQRAGALVPLFEHARAPLQRPTALFAAASRTRSRRPEQTLRPLAERLGLPIHHDWEEDETEALVEALLAQPGPALVCWRHDQMVEIADALLGDGAAPREWPESCFDLVWIFERAPGERGPDESGRGSWRLRQQPQALLAGDRPEGLPGG